MSEPKHEVEFIVEDCIGCGACASQCPENWVMIEGDQYKSKPVKTKLTDEELPNNKEALEVCPVNCIRIHENKLTGNNGATQAEPQQ